jgi:hypothetical protein
MGLFLGKKISLRVNVGKIEPTFSLLAQRTGLRL